MKHISKLGTYVSIAILILLSIFVIPFLVHKNNVSYATSDKSVKYVKNEQPSSESATPYLFTQLSISLNGGNGKVWITVKNDFTFLPSTVMVIVQLYYSDTYCEDYQQMTLVASDSTMDLDMGKTITVEASTGGQQRYWMGRMRYKVDSADWKEKTVGVGLYSAEGNFIGIN